jgi:hypothetical protein
MSVYGRAPSSPEGRYFRSNNWCWSPILDAIANAEVLPEEMVREMAYNEGAGPDAEDAAKLADAIEARLSRTSCPRRQAPRCRE